MIAEITYYYTSLSFFLYKNMTVVLLLHPKINCMTIPPVVPVKNCRTILYRKHFVVFVPLLKNWKEELGYDNIVHLTLENN
jgi:hypothetical protein